MYSEYHTFDELKAQVLTDFESTGMDVSTRNRYPIRFVLLDNFHECSLFVDFVREETNSLVQSVDKWIDPEYPDLMITHIQLAQQIKDYIRKNEGQNCVIAPFSELARFYDNDEKKTFDALLKTVKAIEATPKSVEKHQRVYVPIVGLEGKMEAFSNDSQSIIWRLRSTDKELTYRLILTNGTTFGVQGLEKHYTVVHNIHEWLNVWKDADKQVTPNIICTSRSIFANQCYAQPDNAFVFAPCSDAFDFLTKGLELAFGGMTKVMGDNENWDILAQNIDISNGFSFAKYVENYFSVSGIDSYKVFIKLWLDRPAKYERWLLARFYQLRQDGNGFICRILSKTTTFTGNDFIEQMALDLTEIQAEMEERQYCLREAAKRHVVLREGVETTLVSRLQSIAQKYTVSGALKYYAGITDKEKELAVSWIGKELVPLGKLKEIYPDLYHYYSTPLGISVGVPSWLEGYMKEYKRAKISNVYTAEIEQQIISINHSEVSFDTWYQTFCTTLTLLQNRKDIEVFYWVDGLGIEWISLIKEIIREKNSQGIYLNEVKIARALLPSTTEVNKPSLQSLLTETLRKAGDLDNLAHQSTNLWPTTIVKELQLVRDVVEDIIEKYNDKKVAIISDHGLTYLSQLCKGIGLNGVESDHHGRIAIKTAGTWTADNNYFRMEDGKTVCALRHSSLCNKVPKGQGIHGGCTPEEVLVPIFIVSSCVSGTEWSADLLTLEISGANPTIKFRIKNIPSTEIPFIEYNNGRYALHQANADLFESEPIAINEQCTVVTLVIGNVLRPYNISVSAGAEEDDLFSGF